jgi:hypothetical protein
MRWSSLVQLCMSIQCRVYLQCSYLHVFFIIKVYFPGNLDWVGHENFFVSLDGLWNFYLHPKMGHRTYWQNLWFTFSPP